MGLTQVVVRAAPPGIGLALASVLTIFTDLSLGSSLVMRGGS